MGRFFTDGYEHCEPPNGPFTIMPDNPEDKDVAASMSKLLNMIWGHIQDWEVQMLVHGYHRPPYDPYEEFTKYCKHLRWQKFIRYGREDATS